MPLNLDKVRSAHDVARKEVQNYTIPFTLNAKRISSLLLPPFPLHWSSIKFNDATQIHNIPDDMRGIYAFVVAAESPFLPTHGYIMYIGIAGFRSKRSLRARYQDYLDTKRVLDRPNVMGMVATWHDVLRFFFAPVDNQVTSEQLEALECTLNSAWMPPYVDRDVDATTRKMRKAFP